jgi:DNA-directed RNA polymerase subunit alpha
MGEAARVLINHLHIVAGVKPGELITPMPGEEIETDKRGSYDEERFNTPIESLDLSVRVFNSLKRTGITTVGEVLEMLDRGPDAMLAIRNFGEKSLDELVGRLKEKGFLAQDADVAPLIASPN